MNKQFVKSAEFSSAIKEDLAKWNLVILKVILQCMGVWPEEQHKVVIICGYIFIINGTLMEIFVIWYLIKNINDMRLTLATAPIVLAVLQLLIRWVAIIAYKKKLQKILLSIWFEFLAIKAATTEMQQQIYFRALFNRTFIYMLSIFTFVASVQYLSFFLVIGNFGLPFFFPFSMQSPIYELIYVWQWSVCAVLICVTCSFDSLYVTLLTICVVQFQIINSNLELLGTSNVKDKIRFISMCNGKQKLLSTKYLDNLLLKTYIKQHLVLIKTCTNLAFVFKYVLLIQLLIVGATICLFSFLMVKYPNETLQFMPMPLYMCVQQGCSCWFGHELTSQAEKSSLSAYNSKWYEIADLQLQKSLIPIIQASNQEMAITAGGFAKMNLNLLVQIFKFSMSLYTLLGKIVD